jgi:hypothetical protein
VALVDLGGGGGGGGGCGRARDSFECRIAQETAGEEDEGVGTALHCTAAALHCCCTALLLHCTAAALHCCCTALLLHCTAAALHCTALHCCCCTALHCTALHCTALLLPVTARPLISFNRAGGGEAAPNQRVPCRGAGHGRLDAGCSGRGVDFSSNVRAVVMIVIAL